ncbi:MAG: RHS repeat-associated core domain-containing protein, partial [Nannocystaceae bacterium]
RQHVWDERGLLRSVATPEGTTTLTHDVYKQLTAIRLPGGVEHHYGYDNLGRVVRVEDPTRVTTTMVFDTEGRHCQTSGPLGVWERMSYDPEGNLVRAVRPNRDVELRWGSFRKLVERQEHGTTTRFEHDSEGRLVRVINEAGELHRFELDELGRVVEETTFDGRTRRMERDAVDRITSIQEVEGTTAIGFDAMDRIVEVGHGDGTTTRFDYDPLGRVLRAANGDADVVFERDGLGRVVAESQDGGGTWVRSAYAGTTRRAALRSDLGAHQEIEYDERGEITALVQGSRAGGAVPARIELRRDPLGHELGRRLPGGVEVAWNRDPVGRPLQRVVSHATAGRDADTHHYQWRGDDQIASITREGGQASVYEHDRRGRLVVERRAPGDRIVDRTMDDVDNIIGGGGRSYGPGGRLLAVGQTAYEYDGLGRQAARIEPDGRRWEYRWNGAGLLAEVARPDGKRVRFSYDAFARRTAKRVVTVDDGGTEQLESERRFVWDGATVLHELDPSEPPEQGLTTWYWESETRGPVLKEGPQGRASVVTDHLGRPTELYDQAGHRVWRMHLDVFGVAEVSEGEAGDCPWRWPGQYEDAETGDAYNRWRYYDPSTGIYRSPDPVGLWGGLRPHAYPADPLTRIDPLGWMPLSIPTNQGHHIVPHSGASTLGVAPFNSQYGVPSYYFNNPPDNAHSLVHGYNMGLDSTSRPALTEGAIGRQGLDADSWLQSLRNHYSRPELAGLRGDLRIVTSTGPGEVIARNLSPLEAFERALQWGRERGGCY